MDLVAFQTRARTIDHLGRGQIADCPTAVSELWKNSYDAYAENVGLHIFDGPVPAAGLVDDGHGMNRDEFIDRWLVVGTDSKLDDSSTALEDRGELPLRERQGEKGIGRLSVAYLGPVVLVLSKRSGQPFVASLVDWRLFENPYLVLSDITIPVAGFSRPSEFDAVLPMLFDRLVDNIWPTEGDKQRIERVNAAWQKLSEKETARKLTTTTADSIAHSAVDAQPLLNELSTRHLNVWAVWKGEKDHGTALFVLGVNHELALWVRSDTVDQDAETLTTKQNLIDTLTGFVDPYRESIDPFNYSVVIHKDNGPRIVLSANEVFGLDSLRGLEHEVEGRFDENGIFQGTVRAFGHALGRLTVPPARIPRLGRTEKVGPFDLCIGTFEQLPERSTHDAAQHEMLTEMAIRYAGLSIYRDGLRVMPYGRPKADFFGIEERRTRHLGREFWSYRRTFGRVALTRSANSNLRDKAGREGLIDNRAMRELHILVVDLLKLLARRYFNADSEPSQKYLPEIIANNKTAKEGEEKAKKRRTDAFRRAMKSQSAPLDEAMAAIPVLKEKFLSLKTGGGKGLTEFGEELGALIENKEAFDLPPKPRKLGNLEADYRDYRDRYNTFRNELDALSTTWRAAVAETRQRSPEEEAGATIQRHKEGLSRDLGRWGQQIQGVLIRETQKIRRTVDEDRERYYPLVAPLLTDLVAGRVSLENVLNESQLSRDRIRREFEQFYTSYIRALELVSEGVDLEAALAWSGEQRDDLQAQVGRLNALAQLGITVEIVGHELEDLDAEMVRNMNLLPTQIKSSAPYRMAISAHRSLVDRLRFLAPMKLSGQQFREDITGQVVADYLANFFGRRLISAGITLECTDGFRRISFRDFPSRIYPVFINLVNNSLYWVSFSSERRVLLDTIGDLVVVADTGPGVDPDDRTHLFDLFFTRRVEGRGVGLFLSKANLSAGGHTIEYSTDPEFTLLPGANFLIRFKGVSHGPKHH